MNGQLPMLPIPPAPLALKLNRQSNITEVL
jgi:hypothetical protein